MTDLDTWIKGFPREGLEAEAAQLRDRLSRVEQALALHDALARRNGGELPGEAGETPTKPQAVLTILRERDQPVKPGLIREEMIKRGWLGEGPRFAKRFYATMSRMTAEGRILRLEDGRYILPPDLLDGDRV